MDVPRLKSGFTLIEMIIVVAIIALLAAMIIGGAGALDNQGKQRAVENLFGQIEAALDAYYDFNGSFPAEPAPPTTEIQRAEAMYAALYALADSRTVLAEIDGSFVLDRRPAPPVICDPWKTPVDYSYTAGMQYPTLTSAGPDKMFGTADDIRNK